jgi:hypothetical protein
MHRHLFVTSSAAIVVAAVGLAGCSHSASNDSPSAELAVPTGSTAVAAVPAAPLPAPEALTDVLSRLADPAVPGSDKVNLVEAATPETASNLDKFGNALRDGGYLPMTFTATNLAWSDKNPSNVTATISVNTARPNTGAFTFPMEFTPSKGGGWQLSRKTAEMLLSLRNSPGGTPTIPSPTPSPVPAPLPTETPSPAPAPPPTESPSPAPSSSPSGPPG